MKMETLKQQILTAKGDVRAELVLKNARVINVFTNEIEQADVAIRQGVILGVGHYIGETELDLQGKYVCPGLVDGHIHIESSMLCGPAFEQAVLPHGTTAVAHRPARDLQCSRYGGAGFYAGDHQESGAFGLLHAPLLRACHRAGRVRRGAGSGAAAPLLSAGPGYWGWLS